MLFFHILFNRVLAELIPTSDPRENNGMESYRAQSSFIMKVMRLSWLAFDESIGLGLPLF